MTTFVVVPRNPAFYDARQSPGTDLFAAIVKKKIIQAVRNYSEFVCHWGRGNVYIQRLNFALQIARRPYGLHYARAQVVREGTFLRVLVKRALHLEQNKLPRGT